MREIYIDYGKAILVIAVIAGHAGFFVEDPWNYLFMIFFFFVTGYTYTVGKRSLSAGIKRRFARIQVPVWTILSITIFLDMIRATYFGYGDCNIAKADIMFAVYGSHLVPKAFPFTDFFLYEGVQNDSELATSLCYSVITPLNCHLWFLVTMFSGCVLFFTYVEKLRRQKWLDVPVIMLLLLIAGSESIHTFQFPFSLGRGCFACACMIAAVNVKEQHILSAGTINRKFFCALVAACVFAVTILHGANNCYMIISVYGDNSFLSVLMVWLNGVSGSILILYLMQILEHRCASPTLAFIGRNTLTIYLWNMILLTIFALAMLKVTGNEVVLNPFHVTLFPTNAYVPIFVTTALAVACGALMARYKNSHGESVLAKFI